MRNKERRKAYSRAYYRAHWEEQKARNRAYDEAHREEKKAYDQVYRQVHKEKLAEKSRARRQAYLPRYAAREQAYRQTHREQRKAIGQAYKEALKAEALRNLGSKCACPGCEVAEPRFLTIDHILGHANRRNYPVMEAKASGWDKTKFQVLCWNCNMAKRDRGFCPVHQKDPGQRNGHISGPTAQLAFTDF